MVFKKSFLLVTDTSFFLAWLPTEYNDNVFTYVWLGHKVWFNSVYVIYKINIL